MEHVSKYIYLSNKSQYPADKSLSKYGGVRKIHLDILIRETHVGSHKYVPLRTLGQMNHIHDIQFKSDLFTGPIFFTQYQMYTETDRSPQQRKKRIFVQIRARPE